MVPDFADAGIRLLLCITSEGRANDDSLFRTVEQIGYRRARMSRPDGRPAIRMGT
jgi:hypothetical protein